MQISPSILAADFANLEAELAAIGSADWAHVDVMDNHFVPNLTLGLPVVEALIRVSPIPIDCHLMIDDPDRWAPAYAEAGAQSVTFHVEVAAHPQQLARALRAAGSRAGLALKPDTAWQPYAGLLPEELLRSLSVAEPEANWVTAIGDGPAAGVATVVALAAGGLVGFASVGPARDDDLSEDVSELWSLYVHPDSWGTGVGHALHSRALLRMRERAASSGTLWVLTANDRARRFYEAHGWLADGTEQTAWRADVPLEESRYRLPDLT